MEIIGESVITDLVVVFILESVKEVYFDLVMMLSSYLKYYLKYNLFRISQRGYSDLVMMKGSYLKYYLKYNLKFILSITRLYLGVVSSQGYLNI